ncbi:hypothetical protein NPIL_492951 [Nephila pilipes]|uniref:Uncharacterized protein n=1 Tax=Nephila pilipes TaxID=299642 RepID=A0A8X6NCN2_NEPPI|nr:hypothetical protein NPIL_492951 [Nephila pilipes]
MNDNLLSSSTEKADRCDSEKDNSSSKYIQTPIIEFEIKAQPSNSDITGSTVTSSHKGQWTLISTNRFVPVSLRKTWHLKRIKEAGPIYLNIKLLVVFLRPQVQGRFKRTRQLEVFLFK